MIFESATAQGTVGLSAGITAPTMPATVETLILQMWLGRLEIIPVLVFLRALYVRTATDGSSTPTRATRALADETLRSRARVLGDRLPPVVTDAHSPGDGFAPSYRSGAHEELRCLT